MTLVLDDLEAALEDDRHHGWGYATKTSLGAGIQAKLDCAVIDVANELGLDYEELFMWTNSKYGRWLIDSLGSPTKVLVREQLNQDAIDHLNEEEGN